MIHSFTHACALVSSALICAVSRADVPVTTTLVASGLTKPLCITHAPNDASRMFVVEKAGRIKIIQGGIVLPAPFLDMSSLVNASTLEWGLLSLCFDPGYAQNGWFYVYYSAGTGGDSVIARFQVSADPNVASLASHEVILYLPQPNSNHRGSWLGFGNDGFLYASLGDGGPQEDLFHHAQDLSLLQGKILRLDTSGDDFPADASKNYRIPPGNPLVAQPGAAPEIWAYGLRNPWRCSFDRQTGDLWIGDVGEYAREELDVQPAGVGGSNYGWSCTEGTVCTTYGGCTCNAPAMIAPVHEYGHTTGRSVTCGYVYRGSAIAGLQGAFFFGDYQLGKFWSLRWDGTSVSQLVERTAEFDPPGASTLANPSSFGEDAQGEIYVCDFMDGEVYKIIAAPDVVPPQISITSPTSSASWLVTSPTVDVAGVASDNVGVTGVAWSNATNGASGNATGTTSWSAAAITLVPGTNVLTFTATDGALNNASSALNVGWFETPVAYCFGDASGTPCPCGNVGASGNGCPTSFNAAGANLAASGTPDLSADTLTLLATGLSSSTVTFFQGTTRVNGGAGALFGDGLRCAGGATFRIGAVAAVSGAAQYPSGASDPVSVRGSVTSAGSVRTYQVWFRNAASFCNPETFNLTNGLSVLWLD